MKDFATKPDMIAIRREGQAFLAEIEKRGHILPSLEDVQSMKTYIAVRETGSDEFAGFTEDRKPQVIKPK